MNLKTKRVMAALLALSAIFVGGWAASAPRSFYQDFPLPGWQWVSMMGPFNDHLIRDVGGLYLALFVITAWVTLRPSEVALRMVGLGWLVFNVEHFTYHALHLHMFSVFHKVTMMFFLGAVVVFAALLVVPAKKPAGTTEIT